MKTAVILAARKDRDTDIPYPLQEFKEGFCLIDRTLDLLEELYFEQIYLVVGFQAEAFQKYSSDKVTILYNSQYEFTSSMGSLSVVADYVKEDFLLIEGDTFFEKVVLEQMVAQPYPNCLSITEESGSGDEAFVETEEGFVMKLSKDRHQIKRFDGEMMGISKISLATFNRMLESWKKCTNPYINYEYLFMDCTQPFQRPFIFFKNVIWGDVDCSDDFRKLQNYIYRKLIKKENPYNKENLKAYLKEIFNTDYVCEAGITQIGGLSNKNFLVDIHGRKFVLRVPGIGSDGMVERSNEEMNSILACRMGINPDIRYFNAQTGIKLADFIVNAETLNEATIQRHENMKKVVEIYKTLHNSHVRLNNEFNVFREIQKYGILIEQAGAEMYLGFKEVYMQVMALENYLNTIGVDLKPCHNDAVSENFIKSQDGKLFLIDWEYSGMNDPMADFAALFLENNFTEENQDFVLNLYFDGNIPTNTNERILCYKILWDYLWAQWTVIKESKGDDFGSYGIDRYRRAIDSLKSLNITK